MADNELNTGGKVLKENEVILTTRCAWSSPPKNGVIVCLNNRIVLKYFKPISGFIGLLTLGLLSVVLYPVYANKIKEENDYSMIKKDHDIVIPIKEIQSVQVKKGVIRNKVTIFKNNGDKKIVYLTEANDLDKFVNTYDKVNYVN